MKGLMFVVLSLMVSGCSTSYDIEGARTCAEDGCKFGPLEMTHKEGEFPKLHLNTSESCRVRGKGVDEVYYRCEWELR